MYAANSFLRENQQPTFCIVSQQKHVLKMLSSVNMQSLNSCSKTLATIFTNANAEKTIVIVTVDLHLNI